MVAKDMKTVLKLVVGLVLSAALVQSELTVTWQEETVTGPLLIYHSEIPDAVNDSNGLICSHQTRTGIAWHLTRGAPLVNSGGTFNNIITNGGRQAQIMRGTHDGGDETGFDGLWTCRLNGATGTEAFHVGIYDDTPTTRNGAITTVQGHSSPFNTNPISFQLFGDSIGGPPTTSYWTRNDANITNDNTFRITISFTGSHDDAGHRTANYQSTVTVTGRKPGTYLYHVSNRRTTGIWTYRVLVDGDPPTDLTLSRVSLDRVRVTWTEPDIRPRGGYRIEVVSGNINMTAAMPPQEITLTPRSTPYEVTLVSLSRHYPINNIMESITLIDLLAPTSTSMSLLTVTSVTISWIQPGGGLTVDTYRVTFNRTSTGMCSGVSHTREENTTSTSIVIDGLEENSIYTVTISSVNNEFNAARSTSGPTTTTLEAAPSGPPVIVMSPTVSSRSITVNWTEIPCIQRNGRIIRYEVVFGPSGEGTISGRSFTANGLDIFTNYTFQVRGVNSVGSGPYSNLTVITTSEEAPGPVSNLTINVTLTSVNLFWSPPEQPNGILTRYEVTYRLNSSNEVINVSSESLSTTFTIQSLTPETGVVDISVSAYTSAGQGPPVMVPNVVTLTRPPEVMGVEVEIVTDTSVRVSWERILNIPEITHYTVFYSRAGRQDQNISINMANDSVVIGNLSGGSKSYQFVVVAVATVNNTEILGERSTNLISPSSDRGSSPVGLIIGLLVLAIAIVAVVVVILGFLWLRRCHVSGSHKTNVDSIRYTPNDGPLLDKPKHIEPVIEEFPDDTTAVEGEGVFFKVVVSGKPEPTLTWYHNKKELTPNYSQEIERDGSLSIPSTELKHGGMYRLVARNSLGRAEQEVKLSVVIEGENTPEVEHKSMDFIPIPVKDFGKYVAKNHNNNNQGFKEQFQGLESGDNYPKTVGLSPKYKKHNRFANITVYDHNRIVLNPIPGHNFQGDFINGCYVDGYSLEKKFIATQGPIPKTTVDFWTLIWQEKPPIIVMVTNLKEDNKSKCEQYWPDSGTGNFGPFKVTLTEHQVFADYCIRTMQVTLEGNYRPFKLQQFHFTAWPDHGVPDYATPILAFHRRIISTHNPKRGPILVHCSAGIGRTGTFICIDNVLDQIEKEQVVDIAGAINKMRHQRMKMVQTVEQYVFLHDAILESVTCGDTQVTAADLRMMIKKYGRVDPITGLTGFQSQFKVLEQVSPKVNEVICTAATKNPDRNRSTKYLPADRFRVILRGEHPDYIHAVFAHGYKHQKAYIIAEGPMASTARNMLKILYDRKCGAVVMLSDRKENGKESSCQYWPATGQMSQFGEYTVDLISEEPLGGFTIRALSILENKSQKAHQVIQFHIACWEPDGRCTNLKSIVDTIDEVAKVQRKTGNKPIFIHCSDTVTRSGMFCAMATVIDRCKTEGVVDVFQVVKALRVQKPGAVPTVEDYKSIFNVTLTFLDSFDTYANFQNV